MARLALRLPVLFGVNTTPREQELPAATLAPALQLLPVVMRYSEAAAPLMVSALIVSAALPLLDSVKVCAAELLPTVCE